MNTNLLMTAITPHPPIIIPEVGRTETLKVQKTIDTLQALSNKIVQANPETIIIITPHSYLNPRYFNAYADNLLEGNFANFGAPEVRLRFENDLEFINTLENNVADHFEKLSKIPENTSLDHGSTVPLYYLAKAGYSGKIAVINYSALNKEEHILFGNLIRKSIEELNKKFVFIASGDLSHRLLPSAPAGFNPEAKLFDEYIIDKISDGDYNSIVTINQNLRSIAGECAYNSLMVGIGVINKQPQQNQVLSYEAPFGVGYIIATL